MIEIIAIALIPALQLGVSYYLSVATFSCLALVIHWIRPLFRQITEAPVAAVLCVAMIMLNPTLGSDAWDADMLRAGREGIVFVFIVAATRQFSQTPPIKNPLPLLNIILPILIGFLVLCLIQAVLYRRGVYFGLPVEFYAYDAKTLPTILALTYGVLRPNATFQEPSYLGFVLTSFAVMLNPLIGHSRKANLMMVLVLITGLLSQSLAFVIAFVLVVIVPRMPVNLWLKSSSKAGLPQIAAVLGLVVLVVLLLTGQLGVVSDRVGGANVASDTSTTARIIQPVMVLPEFLIEHPFGVTASQFEAALTPLVPPGMSGGAIGHNGLTNIFFLYGILGFVILPVFIFSARTMSNRFYLLAAAIFNGALFAQDKLVMIMLAFAVSESLKRYIGAQRSEQLPITKHSNGRLANHGARAIRRN